MAAIRMGIRLVKILLGIMVNLNFKFLATKKVKRESFSGKFNCNIFPNYDCNLYTHKYLAFEKLERVIVKLH